MHPSGKKCMYICHIIHHTTVIEPFHIQLKLCKVSRSWDLCIPFIQTNTTYSSKSCVYLSFRQTLNPAFCLCVAYSHYFTVVHLWNWWQVTLVNNVSLTYRSKMLSSASYQLTNSLRNSLKLTHNNKYLYIVTMQTSISYAFTNSLQRIYQ